MSKKRNLYIKVYMSRWLNSTIAKDFGTLYLIIAVFAGMIIGTAFSMLIRIELTSSTWSTISKWRLSSIQCNNYGPCPNYNFLHVYTRNGGRVW